MLTGSDAAMPGSPAPRRRLRSASRAPRPARREVLRHLDRLELDGRAGAGALHPLRHAPDAFGERDRLRQPGEGAPELLVAAVGVLHLVARVEVHDARWRAE